MQSTFDVVVLGQGLAGTSLAWWLRWSGAKAIVVDRGTDSTSSKVAAGLITPITGQKLVRGWNLAKLWSVATEFYRRIELQTGSSFFRQLAMVRLLTSPEEVALFHRRLAAGEFAGVIRQTESLIDARTFDTGHGGFEMNPGGQLNAGEYLRASRELFRADGGYIMADVDVSRDIELHDGRIQIPRLGISARRIVFCQGFDSLPNPWFREVQLKPAKGEVLSLRIRGLTEDRVIHRGVWLAPMGGELFKAGSTYDWERLDDRPTPAGRNEILSKLSQFLRLPVEVICHQAAVRPIHRNQHPAIGIHPVHNQLAYFNGLGSKGALQSPYFARQLVELMFQGRRVDPDVDLNRKTEWQSVHPPDLPDRPVNLSPAFHVKRQASRPLTEQAQDAIRGTLRPGEFAIDATAGNGHDTQFLAELVGPLGTVFAFDIQSDSLLKTAARLVDRGLQNVVLLNRNHDRLSASIPPEIHGFIGAVMLNLGYLPGGDKQIKTSTGSTRSAIDQSQRLLRPGGTMTIVSYTGHDGGQSESLAVQQQLEQLPVDIYSVETIESLPGRSAGPRLFIVKRLDRCEL